MAIIKCKMCGGDLNITDGLTVAECEYCGSRQTIPTADNEKKMTLFSRASRLLRGCEFDKAAGVFENIVADFPEEAEAYWGMVLCKYGIEYVDDPATGKKVPTCHRSSFESVLDDANFEQACEYNDAVARRVYRDEARQIEELRTAIIEVSGKEEPYDVFVSYKETDENGERTLDSVIAQDIYDALSEEGYRVFFSRISLEDKLGIEYEPYIFAALNSAKLMLVLGTDYENFDAVWVKNEWSRFLKLMAQDKSKHLIPVFKNMDAYDMPKEFAKLAAQDMGKLGAMQDLLRGVEKLLGVKKVAVAASAPAAAENSAAGALIMRGQFALEDGDFVKAEEFFEHALNIEPQNAEAYIGKTLVLMRVKCLEQIKSLSVDLGEIKDFSRALKFANPERQQELLRIQAYAKKNLEMRRLCALLKARKLKLEKDKQQAELSRELEKRRKSLTPIREQLKVAQSIIAAGDMCALGLMTDGRVLFVGGDEGDEYELRKVNEWTDIVAVSVGRKHAVGLKSNGSVVAVGNNYDGQCSVSGWHDIVAISAGFTHTVGLMSNGSVVAVGNNDKAQCDVSDWRDIVAISAGLTHTVGLKADGTVVATGYKADSKIYNLHCDVSGWTDIVAINAGILHTVGLKADGTVVAVGNNSKGQCDVSDWTDIVALSAGGFYTLGLKADGTVVATGENDCNQCNASCWTNIVALSASRNYAVGLRSDGMAASTNSNFSFWKKFYNIKLFNSIDTLEQERLAIKEEALRRQREAQEEIERQRETYYIELCQFAEQAVTEVDCYEVACLFSDRSKFYNYKDCAELAEKYKQKADKLKAERHAAIAARRAELYAEKSELKQELSELKGLFAGKRRKEIEARMAQIDQEIQKLR